MVNWDITQSSLFTGAGTPWGATQAPTPSSDPYAGVNMDPNAYQGFDRSALKQAMMKNLAKRGMQAQGQARAALQRSGIQGADTSRALVDLAGQQEEAAGALEAEMAYKDWQDRVNERNRAMEAALARWQAQNAAYQQEQAQRGQFWNALIGGGAGILGGLAGGGAFNGMGGGGGGFTKNVWQNPYNISK